MVDGPYEAGDTVLEATVRKAMSRGDDCIALPLLYPGEMVVEQTSAVVREVGSDAQEVQHTRVYFLDRLDGEGSMVVKQTSTLAAAREAFVLLELHSSAGPQDGAPPCFPSVFGSLVTQSWAACALSNFEGALPLAVRVEEEPGLFNETGVVFDIFDRLLQV